jgi:hypothetical protein
LSKLWQAAAPGDIGERMTMKAGNYPGRRPSCLDIVNPVLYLLDIETLRQELC